MKCVRLKQLVLGEGMPKICAPLVGTGRDALLAEAEGFLQLPIDVAEWRADWYEGILETGILGGILPLLRAKLPDLPLLFTFRTHTEGGHLPADLPAYETLLSEAICSGMIDLVDAELFAGDAAVKRLIKLAHSHGVKVILSNHDFDATPAEDELSDRLHKMAALGADIAKLAVMPNSPLDVLTLLSATAKASQSLSCPIISMSMKGAGLISRIGGEVFGSCLTFGSAGNVSAPGQIDVRVLREMLQAIHGSL